MKKSLVLSTVSFVSAFVIFSTTAMADKLCNNPYGDSRRIAQCFLEVAKKTNGRCTGKYDVKAGRFGNGICTMSNACKPEDFKNIPVCLNLGLDKS